MTNDEGNSSPPTRKNKRSRVWRFISVILALMIGGMVWTWIKDINPVEDSKMLPTFTEGGGPNNPLRVYTRALVELPDSGYEQLSPDAKDRKHGQESVLAEYLSQPEVVRRMELWDELMKTDPASWRWRLQDQLPFRQNYSEPSLDEIRLCMALQRIRVTLLAREGKVREAVELALQMIKMGEAFAKAEGTAIMFLIAITDQQIAYATLEEVLSEQALDETLLTDVLNHLSKVENLRESLQLAFKVEYLHFKDVNHEVKERDLPSLKPNHLFKWIVRGLWKYNLSLSLMQEMYGPMIELKTRDASAFLEAAELPFKQVEAWKRRGWTGVFDRSSMAYVQIGLYGDTPFEIVKRALANEVMPSLLKLNVALRLYELKHGKLPENLEALKMEFSLPIDPFDGQPLRWNPKTQSIYSVWINKSDDGGQFMKSFALIQDPMDFGMIYSWSPEAKREAEGN